MDTAYKTTLELDKVLNRAVQLCACQETKEMMQALEPAPTIEDERYDLTQTTPSTRPAHQERQSPLRQRARGAPHRRPRPQGGHPLDG